MQNTKVYIVQHVHELPGGDEDVKLIGVYSSEERAWDAVSRLAQLPGFAQAPQGFHVDAYELDRDHWTEGFVTVQSPES